MNICMIMYKCVSFLIMPYCISKKPYNYTLTTFNKSKWYKYRLKVYIFLLVFLTPQSSVQEFWEPTLKAHGEKKALHEVKRSKNGGERDQNTLCTYIKMSQ